MADDIECSSRPSGISSYRTFTVYSPLQTAAITISTSKPYVPFPPKQATTNHHLLPLCSDRCHPPPPHPNGLIVELISLSTTHPLCLSLYIPAEPCCGLVGDPRAARSRSNSEWFPLSHRTAFTNTSATLVSLVYGQQLVSRIPP
jgi:hypothetical protein